MGIERRLATYTTLLRRHLRPASRTSGARSSCWTGRSSRPARTFSFNDRVGERTVERGFRPAPVIISDEYEEDVGGGVSQVATTVFNAAWEAGARSSSATRTRSTSARYQLGRDATVNYPDLDLKFLNDTPNWILVAASWDGERHHGLALRRRPGRRVESSAGTFRVTGPGAGARACPTDAREGDGRSSTRRGRAERARRVTRTVYDANGTVLHDETWNTCYRGEYRDRPLRDEAEAEGRRRTEEAAEDEAAPADRGTDPARPRRRPRPSRRRLASALATASTNHGGTRVGRNVARVDGRVGRPAVRDELVRLGVALEHVLVAEARAAQVDAARADA